MSDDPFVILFSFPGVIAFFRALYVMNRERTPARRRSGRMKRTRWSDTFLRSITSAVIWYVVSCLIEGALLLAWYVNR